VSHVGLASAVVTNGRVVTPDAVIDGGVRIEGDRIAAVGDVNTDAETVVDAGDRYVLPGLIDLHGDDIESHLYPRSGVQMDVDMTLVSADRANVAAGITTKFHAVSFERDSEKRRSPELGAKLSEAIATTDDLVADHRLHARCEVTQAACVEAVLDVVDRGHADMVSVMSHVPGKGQFRDEEAFLEYYRESSDHSVETARELIEDREDVSMASVRERVDRVVEAAHGAGAVTASHDDEDPTEIERLANAGVDISEYPITLETARRATTAGMTTVMGAPNLVRGESQWGNLRTADAIEADVVDALVADYHPMSLLASVFVETGEPLPDRVGRVTAAPAAAAGLEDRGRLEQGARADLVVVDPDPAPTVTRGFVAGRPVYRAEGSL
jgi:alpha-D-ribose 1-methylphosphonate 5-triphosphate diphosphatase